MVSSGTLELLSQAGDTSLILKRSDGHDTAYVVVNLTDKPAQIKILTGEAHASFADILHLPLVDLAPVSADGGGQITVTVPAKRAVVLQAHSRMAAVRPNRE